MAVRPVGILMDPQVAEEAKGVEIRRTVGSERLVLLDPVLLLDHLHVPASADTASVGFPRHPHRGIETLTYVFKGRVHHRDSLGNDDAIGALGSQWMTAGDGIYHAEMLEPGPDGVEGLQIWFNLPAAEKKKSAAYRAADAGGIPEVALTGGGTARVVAGTLKGVSGPFSGIAARPTYLDVRLPADGASVTLDAPAGETAFAYVYRGAAVFGGASAKTVTAPQLAIFGDGDTIQARALGDNETRFIFVSAAPLREPVLQYRSLVMNTVDEMRQTLEELENGTFASAAGSSTGV